jgi:hypothetical protein
MILGHWMSGHRRFEESWSAEGEDFLDVLTLEIECKKYSKIF